MEILLKLKVEIRFFIAIYLALDQNNTFIKGVGGTFRLVSQDKDVAQQQLQIENVLAITLKNKYEKFHHIGPERDIVKHHEYYSGFQKLFFIVMKKLFSCVQDICNSFKEDELIFSETGEAMISEI